MRWRPEAAILRVVHFRMVLVGWAKGLETSPSLSMEMLPLLLRRSLSTQKTKRKRANPDFFTSLSHLSAYKVQGRYIILLAFIPGAIACRLNRSPRPEGERRCRSSSSSCNFVYRVRRRSDLSRGLFASLGYCLVHEF